MPGTRWKPKELQALESLRRAGVGVIDIVNDPEVLPGRTLDAIAQMVRRKRWADPEASKRCREVEKLEGEAHRIFVKFLRDHGAAPIEQLVLAWNKWAREREWPTVSPSRVIYWLGKLNIPHSRGQAWCSKFAKKKRNEKKAERFVDREAELKRRIELELIAVTAEAQQRRGRQQKCGHCRNSWPIHEDFFAHLPRTFAFGGMALTGFQFEFCKFCQRTTDWRLLLYRAYGKETQHLVSMRRDQLRKGLDAAHDEIMKAELAKCRKRIYGKGRPPTRVCIRCATTWPLERKYFRPNRGLADGSPTFRAICAFCDDMYARRIDRLRRDGADPEPLIRERHYFLELARRRSRQEAECG